eukprot:CFRG4124T1
MGEISDDECVSVALPAGRKGTIVKWHVKEGSNIYPGQDLCVYRYEVKGEVGEIVYKQKVLRTAVEGTVARIVVADENECDVNTPIILIKETCKHELVSMGLCNSCGMDVTFGHFSDAPGSKANAEVSMIHGVPDLKVSKQEAHRLGQMDKKRLIQQKKLVLILDLDQTLLHATASMHVDQWLSSYNYPRNDIYTFVLPSAPTQFWVKLRPYVRELLNGLSSLYELHIYTHGSREYAVKIASILDESGKMFSGRILSRDDGFDQMYKAQALSSLFPQGDEMVVIIDDRKDVWQDVNNLVKVVPYVFFSGVPDINATAMDIKQLQNEEKRAKLIEAQSLSTEHQGKATKGDNTSTKGVTKGVSTKNKDETTNNEECDKKDGSEAANNSQTIIHENPSMTKLKQAIVTWHESDDASSPIPETDLAAWRKLSLSNALKLVIRMLSESRFKDAVVRLGAIRQAFLSVEALKAEAESRFGKSKDDDESILTALYANLQRADPLLNGAPPKDNDEVLIYLEPVLKSIHASYFSKANLQFKREANVKQIIPSLKKEVLSGCRILFSSIIPTMEVPETNPIWKKAEAFGARCFKDLDDDVTHVVGLNASTEKVTKATAMMTGVCVVHYEWLKESMNTWTRMNEDDFPISGVPVRNKEYESTEHTHSGEAVHRKLSFAELDNMDAEVDKEMDDISSDDDSDEQEDTSVGNHSNHTINEGDKHTLEIRAVPPAAPSPTNTASTNDANEIDDVHGLGLSDDDDSENDLSINDDDLEDVLNDESDGEEHKSGDSVSDGETSNSSLSSSASDSDSGSDDENDSMNGDYQSEKEKQIIVGDLKRKRSESESSEDSGRRKRLSSE